MEEINKHANDNSWAAFAHLSAFSSVVIPFGNILGPLIIWLAKRSESEFVERHASESLNFQISFLIYSLFFLLGFIISLFSNLDTLSSLEHADGFEALRILGRFFTWLIPLAFFALFQFIVIIMAALKAGEGKDFRYPLSIRFIN